MSINHERFERTVREWKSAPAGKLPELTKTELCDAYLDLAAQLECRPRIEFVAVGWWDGKQALFESGMKPERGALLFRPLSDQSDSAP